MAYNQKKTPDEVKEQPGSMQKKSNQQKKAKLKNEMANNTRETGLDHPSCSYDTYKRRCE